MAIIPATSSPCRLPVVDGRSIEARYLKRVRADLIAQCNNAPSASQKLLIDRIAAVSLRIHMLDNDMSEPGGRDYLDLTMMLAQLLAQLGAQPTTPTAVLSLREAAA